MWFLALDSSTQVASVALFQNTQSVSWLESRVQKSHSEHLNDFVKKLLDSAKISPEQLSFIGVGIGPGSFTGIRVAVNIAKTLSYSLSIPLVAVHSLESLAQPYVDQKLPVLSLINAYKNMSYFSIHSTVAKVLTEVHAPGVIQMKDIQKILDKPHLTVGDGYLFYEKFLPQSIKVQMVRPSHPADYPSAPVMGLLALEKYKKGLTFDWKSLNPLYIRSSEAEETAQGIVWSPLDFKE